MFGRSKTLSEQQAEVAQTAREGAKNRPTPTRKEREAVRRRPLVEADRKAAKTTDKLKRREQTARTRQAMLTGDESALPARDRGPARRYVRDYVDARWSIGEFMLPVMIVVLALSFVGRAWALTIIYPLVYGLLVVAAADAFLMWRRTKKRLEAKFGADKLPSGLPWYAVMRAFQMRRTRMPRPLVKRGEYPS